MIDNVDASHRGAQTFLIPDVAVGQTYAKGLKWLDSRRAAHQPHDLVPALGEDLGQMTADESAGAGDQDFGHGTECFGECWDWGCIDECA